MCLNFIDACSCFGGVATEDAKVKLAPAYMGGDSATIDHLLPRSFSGAVGLTISLLRMRGATRTAEFGLLRMFAPIDLADIGAVEGAWVRDDIEGGSH